MKRIRKLLGLGMFLSFSIAVCSINSSTLSWFNNKVDVDDGVFGQSAAAYFAGGDGSESNPYILTNQRHLYNLAWLQYLGYFNQDTDSDGTIDKQYYFKVNNDFDCNGLAIPPIGTTKYPFIGSFDGGNYTISNYTITDTYSKLVSHPGVIDEDNNEYHTSSSATINYCSIVGTFGVIGSYDSVPTATYDTSINKLENLYLDNVTISTKTSSVLVGCFAGYVNSTIDNCGVHYVKFDIAGNTSKLSSFNNVSDFALIGSYNKEKYKWDEDPDSGGDVGYGTSTDIRALYDEMTKLSLVEKDTGVISSGTALPFKCSDDESLSGGEGSKTINTYGSSRNLTISYSKSISVADGATNIGYYSGPEIKTYKDYFAKSKASDAYKIDYDKITVASVTAGTSSITTIDENIKKYLTTDIDELTRKGDSALVLSGTCYLDTSVLGVKGGYNLIKDAKVGDYSGDLLIPIRSIWVAPVKPGKFQMVIVNKNGQTARLAVWKVQRMTPGDYSTGFVNAYYDNTLSGVEIPAYSDGAYIPYYYGIEVTQEDIDNGYEFVITKYIAGANVYITYIDIGANGGDSTDERSSLTNFDFVTKENNSLTKIKNYDSSTKTYIANDSYSKSNVTFKIGETTDNTTIAFRRLVDTSVGVLYYQSSSILTPSTSGTSNLASSEECTSKSS